MTFLQELWWQIGISWAGALGVLISAVVLYLVFTLIMQVAGQRLSGSMSAPAVAVMALLGALTARAILGNSPTLVGALIAIATLLGMEFALARLRFAAGGHFALRGPRPTVVMVHGHVLPWQLKHLGVQEKMLLTLLRRAGVHHVAEADLVILEPRGSVTVVRRGERIDRRLLRDVSGAGIVPASILA